MGVVGWRRRRGPFGNLKWTDIGSKWYRKIVGAVQIHLDLIPVDLNVVCITTHII